MLNLIIDTKLVSKDGRISAREPGVLPISPIDENKDVKLEAGKESLPSLNRAKRDVNHWPPYYEHIHDAIKVFYYTFTVVAVILFIWVLYLYFTIM